MGPTLRMRSLRTCARAFLICSFASLCAFALLASLGCSSNDSGSVIKSYDDQKSVTLSFFSTNTNIGAPLQHLTAPDGTEIRIVEDKAEYYAKEGQGEEYRDFLESRLLDNSVDIYTINAEDVIEFEEQGLWRDLSDLGAVSILSSDALAQSTYDGKAFSVPLTYTGFGFFWNKSMLDAHGLDVPSNLDEFLDVCAKLKAAGITPYIGNKGYALTVPAMAVGFADLYASQDSERLLDDLSSGATPVSTYMERGFAFVEQLVDEGYLDPDQALATTPREGDLEAFMAGEGAFVCSSLTGSIFDQADFEVVATAIPVLEHGSVAIVGANDRLAVNPHSPNSDYAAAAIDLLCTPENLTAIARKDGVIPPLADADTGYLHEGALPLARTAMSDHQIPNQDFRLHFNTWASIRDLSREVLQGTSAADAAQRYDEMQLSEISLYGS